MIIDMKNRNILVALAYIKSNNNPLEIFCNYILYSLLKAPNKQLRVDELHDKVLEKFGLNMPQQMLSVCVRILKKDRKLDFLPGGAGFLATCETFKVEKFDATFLRLHEQENKLLDSIRSYINKEYKQEWSQEETRHHLSIFLDEQGNGSNIFLQEEIEIGDKVSPTWYIGRFIDHIRQDTNSLEWTYLVDIVNGMMIYQGVYQVNDYQQDKEQKFKGTFFYFDTKLVLRAMGYSWDAQVQAAKELIQLITKEYGGKIAVFDETIQEVSHALASAGLSYKRREQINNSELRAYAMLHPKEADLLEDSADAVTAWINSSQDFIIADRIDWNSTENRKHSLNLCALEEYIKTQHPDWRPGTISNDTSVINKINILRKGDYSQRYGGKNKLPVFVTTNTPLVYTVKDYAQQEQKIDTKTNWNPHALPVVSENMILFRLWVPCANEHTDLPAITLSRYAYSAQNTDSCFFEKLRKKTVEYQNVKNIDLYNLSEMRRKKLEDIIVEKAGGDPDNVTYPMVATSVDELIRMENIGLQNELNKAKTSDAEKEKTIHEKNRQIIELAARPFYNKLGADRLLIYLAKFWWIIAALILYVLSDIIFKNGFNLQGHKIISIIIALISVTVKFIIERFLSDQTVDKKFMKIAITYVVERYINRIQRNLGEDEVVFYQKIILNCLNNTIVLLKYKEFWPVSCKKPEIKITGLELGH